MSRSVWIAGNSRSGKTTYLVDRFCHWAELGPVAWERGDAIASGKASGKSSPILSSTPLPLGPPVRLPILILAANGDNRLELADRLMDATGGKHIASSTTPIGFFENEVTLFWPLLIEQLSLKAQFPLKLRPETEQELATQLWRESLDRGKLWQEGVGEYRLVRRTLDLMQLAASSGTPIEEIPLILKGGYQNGDSSELWECMGELLLDWRKWCLQRGFLTYGIICELYWRHLLPNPIYQNHLLRRYRGILADDVDEYPAIARYLFEFFLDRDCIGVFTFSPDGGIRVGLGADPNYIEELRDRQDITIIHLPAEDQPIPANRSLQEPLANWMLETLANSTMGEEPTEYDLIGDKLFSIQTISRPQMLQQTVEAIAKAIHSNIVPPEDIAVIAPGLDEIARYTLIESLTNRGIPVEPLNDQRPLATDPIIRALLALLALVYPGLGRLVDRDSIAEMLVVLSGPSSFPSWEGLGVGSTSEGLRVGSTSPQNNIDPVRAGLLADHCYSPAIDRPQLLEVTAFPRWDRLGYRATMAYQEILQWLATQREQLEQRLIPSPISLLDRAIQQFLLGRCHLSYDRLSALRELMETAGHYWQANGRLLGRDAGSKDSEEIKKSASLHQPEYVTVGQFIQMLRQGTVTANPFPVRSLAAASKGVTLGTIFQYRAARLYHPWHFWLDAGSPLWLSAGSATLFGAPLFLRSWSGRAWTAEDEQLADLERLQRIVLDLLGRTSDRLYLCHSDLSTSGQEQTGPLLSFANGAYL